MAKSHSEKLDDIRDLCKASMEFIKFFIEKYNIKSEEDITCPHIRELYKKVMDFGIE